MMMMTKMIFYAIEEGKVEREDDDIHENERQTLYVCLVSESEGGEGEGEDYSIMRCYG
jgi:hypothetical protein